MQRMVALKNMVDSKISVKEPSLGVNRRWERRGQTLTMPFETVEQLLWVDGFRRMIDEGFLYIENLQDKIDLGLEPQGVTRPTNIIALSEKEIVDLLTKADLNTFKATIAKLPDSQIDNVIDYAIAHELVDMQKDAILKEVTKRDILGAISQKAKNAEIDKQIQDRDAARRAEEGRRIEGPSRGRRLGG